MDGSLAKLDEYRKRGLFVDVNFLIGDKEFKAHKMVLSAQSTVFEAMFTSGMEESQSGRVNIVDINPEVFEVFLTYLYTDTVPNATLSNHLEALLYCADKYGVLKLTEVCSNYLERNVKLVRRLFLADMYHLERLKTQACLEIARFGWERLTSDEWYEISTDFHLTTEVLQFVMPSCLTQKWIINPGMWFPPHVKLNSHIDSSAAFDPLTHFNDVRLYDVSVEIPDRRKTIHLPRFNLRNNGRPCELSVKLRGQRKTIGCSIGYHPQSHSPKVVELSFMFSIGNEAHFCGKGDVWWDLADMDNGSQDEFQAIFEHTFSMDDGKNS